MADNNVLLGNFTQGRTPVVQVTPVDGGGSGGAGGDGMDTRVSKLEVHVEHIVKGIDEIKADVRALRSDSRTDFFWLLGGGVTAVVALAGMMAAGFKWFG